MTNTLSPPGINNWLAGYDILPSNGTTPGDLDVYASQAFNFLAQPPYYRAVQTVAQSLPAGAGTALTLDTVVESNNCALGASNVFTASQAGWYSITFTAQAGTGGGVVNLGLQYSINGTLIGPFPFGASLAISSPWAWNCYDEVYLNVGDWVVPYVYNAGASGSATTTVSATFPYVNSSSLEIVWFSE